MERSTEHGELSVLKPPQFAIKQSPVPPVLPSSWECTALLHPYSPPSTDGVQDTPFFQLCVASISYIEGQILSIQVVGMDGQTWWYKVTQTTTVLSRDEGVTWTDNLDIGWTLPGTEWLTPTQSPTYFATSYLNWMQAQEVDWWKQSVANSNATTWIWFDHSSGLPFRMMFGAPPKNPLVGDQNQLAFFQNFSFTYFPGFSAVENPNVDTWTPPVIPGFQAGNPGGQSLPLWNDHFAMTTFMTPVDSASFPLPTNVFYQWKPDNAYGEATDRAQVTWMSYQYNPTAGYETSVALLFGAPPNGMPAPPNAGDGYIFNQSEILNQGVPTPLVFSCQNIGMGQEPPDWASIPAVQGTIHASVTDNAALSPGNQVNIISVLFPPSDEYEQGRYLWTWYSPFPGSDGSNSRPVTFMESASSIAEGGTSLALADYFDYTVSPNWYPPYLFDVPQKCLVPQKEKP
ncbi:hypothetical protein [Pseudomonas sp. A-RE-19]|uniref:hypothetical protein n=1 Tax=Pseudomonas sp. A-RE-19 TaxID=2832401 RepID=UPI001CBD2215|nr:hypothetical protein [Pseudomonas sp. A-RE-19]